MRCSIMLYFLIAFPIFQQRGENLLACASVLLKILHLCASAGVRWLTPSFLINILVSNHLVKQRMMGGDSLHVLLSFRPFLSIFLSHNLICIAKAKTNLLQTLDWRERTTVRVNNEKGNNNHKERKWNLGLSQLLGFLPSHHYMTFRSILSLFFPVCLFPRTPGPLWTCERVPWESVGIKIIDFHWNLSVNLISCEP